MLGKNYKWIILASYAYVAALAQIYWLNFASIETYMETRLNIGPASVMWLTMIFVIVVVVVSIPAGIILDRKGFKYGFGIGTILIAVFSTLRLIAPDSFVFLVICQAGIAIGEPFIFNGITKLANLWFDKKEEATAVGLGSFAIVLGLMISLGLTPALVEHLSYESMLKFYAMLGVIGVILYFAFIKPDPKPKAINRDLIATDGLNRIKHILKIKNFRLLSIVSLLGISVFNGLTTWFEKILHDEQNLTLIQAGIVSGSLMLSGMVGCVVVPYLSDKYQTRKFFLATNLILIILSLLPLLYIQTYIWSIIDGIILGFFLLSSLPIILTMSVETTGPQYAAIAVGFLQLLGNAGGIILIWLIELLRDYNQNYLLSQLLMLSLLFIALMITFKMNGEQKV